MYFSIIIPVYNRPHELEELLTSLIGQSFLDFEVVVVEDGSSQDSREIIDRFYSKLTLSYFFQQNTGQGFARNFGMSQAKGDFFVILDSDVLLPRNYLEVLHRAILERKLDAFGGPDSAASDFSDLQKAMDFAMTSFWTTGGIRGKLKNPANYQARGFNMGVSRQVFETIGGFVDPNRGEDIEWSIRIKKTGFILELVEEAFVYHKRKNTLHSFAKQAFSFGQNRINVSRFHPEAIKLVHAMPSLFLAFLISIPVLYWIEPVIFRLQVLVLGLWGAIVILSSYLKYQKTSVSLLSLVTAFIQLTSYGAGFVTEFVRKWIKG
jgi:glycosyltransferase involved in cell wall biosynthesis